MRRIAKTDIQRRATRGQALVELAVFGAIFIMVLSVLVSYGLRYSFDLQVRQQAYRRALRIASDPNIGTGSYMLMVDKQVPELTDPYGIGSNYPFIVSSSVTRSIWTDAQFDRENPSRGDLPSTVMDVQSYANNSGAPPTIQRHVYVTAAVRTETSWDGSEITDAELTKYQFLYGDVHRAEDKLSVTIVDECSGEVIDYDTCVDHARRLVDGNYCLRLCNNTYSPSSEDAPDCPTLCGSVLNPPNQFPGRRYNANVGGPWYADNWTVSNGEYTFPVLDRLFSYAGDGDRSMGIQSNQTKNSTLDTEFHKVETAQAITTEHNLTWTETKNQTYVWNNNVNAVGYEIPKATALPASDVEGRIVQEPFNSVFTGRSQETWRTPK